MASSTRKRLPRSVRQHIRREKARIRRVTGDPKECARTIAELYKKFGIEKAQSNEVA